MVLVCLFLVQADVNIDAAYNFLVLQGVGGVYNNNVIDTSLAVLALNSISADTSSSLAFLQSKYDQAQGCWPAGSCKIKDTAFAMMAMDSLDQDTSNAKAYLQNAQSVAPINGKWLLQIATDGTGTCKVSFDTASGTTEKSIRVVKGAFPDCGNSTFFDVNACLQSGILGTKAPVELDVNCNDLTNVKVISTIFRAGNIYYLVEEAQTSRATVTVENGCYGLTKKGSCDLDASMWANLALVEVGESGTSEFFLRQSADQNNAFHQAVLVLVTQDPLIAKNLNGLQRNDGSWGGNTIHTTVAIKALEQTEFSSAGETARTYLGKVQKQDGSFGSVFDTALVLWTAFAGEGSTQECFAGQEQPCEQQGGVCSGAKESCVNGTFVGCSEATYKNFNPNYEVSEDSCDGLDNDCDGDIDSGCECAIGSNQSCGYQYGVCAGSMEFCSNGTFNGCVYTNITGFEAIERTCDDNKDNDCDGLNDQQDDDCIPISSICNEDDVCDYDAGEDQNNCGVDCDAACSNGLQDPFEEGKDCGGPCSASCGIEAQCNADNLCETKFGENALDCPDDCSCGDALCDSSEDSLSCPLDCKEEEDTCGNNACDLDEDEVSCPEDCAAGPDGDGGEPTGGSGWIWWVILIIGVFALGGYLFYTKKFKKSSLKKPSAGFSWDQKLSGKKEDKPVFESVLSKLKGGKSEGPSPSTESKKENELEKELDKSIKEAKELLKKK